MASGKTSIGKLLAKRLKLDFIDLDHEIETLVDMSISQIFKSEGEVAFRAYERGTLREILGRPNPDFVLATGGGTFADKTMRNHLLNTATTIFLETGLETILARLSENESDNRPLVQGRTPYRQLAKLLESRLPCYQRCHRSIRTDFKEKDEIVEGIISKLAVETKKGGNPTSDTELNPPDTAENSPAKTPEQRLLQVHAATHNYEVVISDKLRQHCLACIQNRTKGRQLALLTDTTVANLHAVDTLSLLRSTSFKEVHLLQVDPGEASKSMGTASRLYQQLLTLNFNRNDALIALGGGVVGDLGGFVASTFLRGLDFYQIPTTTLAAVDSSVGGKTALNLPRGKNLVGTFYPPKGVFIALTHLQTQTPKGHASGLVESLKVAATHDKNLFYTITNHTDDLINFNFALTQDTIARSIEIKAKVVSQDERESGVRTVLNFGHTVGHALEAGSSFEMFHGEAVALGMLAEAQWAEMEGFCSGVSPLLREAISKLGFKTDWRRYPIDLEAMLLDKKRIGSGVRVPIVDTIGHFDFKTVPISSIADFVNRRRVS